MEYEKKYNIEPSSTSQLELNGVAPELLVRLNFVKFGQNNQYPIIVVSPQSEYPIDRDDVIVVYSDSRVNIWSLKSLYEDLPEMRDKIKQWRKQEAQQK